MGNSTSCPLQNSDSLRSGLWRRQFAGRRTHHLRLPATCDLVRIGPLGKLYVVLSASYPVWTTITVVYYRAALRGFFVESFSLPVYIVVWLSLCDPRVHRRVVACAREEWAPCRLLSGALCFPLSNYFFLFLSSPDLSVFMLMTRAA